MSVTSCLVPWGDKSCILKISSHKTCIAPLAIDSNHKSAMCSGMAESKASMLSYINYITKLDTLIPRHFNSLSKSVIIPVLYH